MAFRGWFALNGQELANSSRVVDHLGKTVPTNDLVLGGAGDSCALVPYSTDAGLALLPASSHELTGPLAGLATPPNGSLRYDPGLLLVGDCWEPTALCGCSSLDVIWDDTWLGLQAYLGDTIYRPELAPWYNANIPQSAEFGGIWVMEAKGFGPPTTDRQIQEMVGSGGTANPHRYTSRKLTFDVLMVACTNAGLEYGVQWLQCLLEETIQADGILTYFTAHPNTAATPDSLLRQLHGVIMTQSVAQTQMFNAGARKHQQATVARASFELVAQDPYSYFSPITLPVTWDSMATEDILWSLPPCHVPTDCTHNPVMLSLTAPPEVIDINTTHPPAILGGGLPVCQIERYVYHVPEWLDPVICRETVVTTTVVNTGTEQLTLQGYWKNCLTPEECNSDQFPFQIAGLPPRGTIILDGVTGKYSGLFDGQDVRPLGIVGTPDGKPWMVPLIDRHDCWQFEILAPVGSNFTVELDLYDREA